MRFDPLCDRGACVVVPLMVIFVIFGGVTETDEARSGRIEWKKNGGTFFELLTGIRSRWCDYRALKLWGE